MLTALSIVAPDKKQPTVLYAPQLLAMLQQAWVGFEKPSGTGVLSDPWVPTKPSQWSYCAKEKPKPTGGSERFKTDSTGLAWLKVGGKYISVKPDSFYASQHEAPGRGSTTAPRTTYSDLAYSDIYATMTEESGPVHDASTAERMRDLLKGKTGGTAVLPLLTSVLFISEVARNHTAFHTNLMMLDLVQKNISITKGTNFRYSFKTVLWNPQIINAVTALRGLDQQQRMLNEQDRSLTKLVNGYRNNGWRLSNNQWVRYQNSDREYQQIDSNLDWVNDQQSIQKGNISRAKTGMDELNKPKLASRGGESAQPGGIASMSHKGSAWGAAYDLEGEGVYRGVKGGSPFRKPSSPMTIVRRKEATILIRWLEQALNKAGMEAVALADNPNLNTVGLYDDIENSFGKNEVAFVKVIQLIQQRTESFDVML